METLRFIQALDNASDHVMSFSTSRVYTEINWHIATLFSERGRVNPRPPQDRADALVCLRDSERRFEIPQPTVAIDATTLRCGDKPRFQHKTAQLARNPGRRSMSCSPKTGRSVKVDSAS
ncbi:MAG: hypothetical protein JJU36_09075 [Phycisphaeraceae bacterium]|nr:hypothetical protein [Phycisphaeraceae bacterium]